MAVEGVRLLQHISGEVEEVHKVLLLQLQAKSCQIQDIFFNRWRPVNHWSPYHKQSKSVPIWIILWWLTDRCWVACHSTLLEDSHQRLRINAKTQFPRLSQRISKTRWKRTTPTSSISAISCLQRRRQSITQVQNYALPFIKLRTYHVFIMKTYLPGISLTSSHSAQWMCRHSRSGPVESPMSSTVWHVCEVTNNCQVNNPWCKIISTLLVDKNI